MRLLRVSVVAGVVLFCMTSSVSAQVGDTVKGTVVDSLLSAVMDSVSVVSEGVTAKTKDGGKFQLVFPVTRIAQTARAQAQTVGWDPSKCLFSWVGFSGGIGIRVMDLSGRIMAQYSSPKNLTKGTYSFDKMPQGIYLATINGQGKTDSYRIVNLSGATGNYNASISHVSGDHGSILAKTSATSKSHQLTIAKPDYKTSTITVAAGTASSPGITVKLVADAPGGVPKTLPIVLFDGVTLNGWSGNPAIWSVKDSSIYGKAPGGHQQSLIITDKDYDDYRFYITLKVLSNHAGVSFGSTRSTKMDNSRWDYNGCSVFMPPREWTWDYGSCGGGFTTHTNNFVMSEWHSAEILMHVSHGKGSMAVDGVLTAEWNKPGTCFKASPVGLQAHDGPMEIYHKNISIEVNPTVDRLITLKAGK